MYPESFSRALEPTPPTPMLVIARRAVSGFEDRVEIDAVRAHFAPIFFHQRPRCTAFRSLAAAVCSGHSMSLTMRPESSSHERSELADAPLTYGAAMSNETPKMCCNGPTAHCAMRSGWQALNSRLTGPHDARPVVRPAVCGHRAESVRSSGPTSRANLLGRLPTPTRSFKSIGWLRWHPLPNPRRI